MRRCWWVVTLMTMLVVMWVVLERLMGVEVGGGVGRFGQVNDTYLFPEKKKSDYNIYHAVQKEGQEETKIQKKIETVEFERVRGKIIVC